MDTVSRSVTRPKPRRLSIGSAALLFAFKDSLENVFGTFTVLLDQPFQLGDWITIVPDDGAKSQTLDTESLFRYFEQLCEDANPAHDKLRYVLALLLLQKRRLRLEGTHRDEDDNDFLDLIGSKSEGPYEVPDLSLDEDEIAQLQASLNHQLEEEWS